MATWVLLRGLTRESRHWGAFPETLRRQIPDATVVALDLPGNGQLFQLPSPRTVEEMSLDGRRQLLDQGFGPPYYLLGMSLGAMVAVAWATHHPEELLGCVLINTSLRPLNPLYQRLRVQNYASLLCLAFFARSAQRRERTILRLTSRHFCSSAQVLGQWLSFARENPVSRGNALRQLLAAARFRAPREKPLPPLLILSSREDALVDSRCSRQIAASWQSPLVEHPSAGHDLALDDGHWVASQVRRWVERERAQRSVR